MPFSTQDDRKTQVVLTLGEGRGAALSAPQAGVRSEGFYRGTGTISTSSFRLFYPRARARHGYPALRSSCPLHHVLRI